MYNLLPVIYDIEGDPDVSDTLFMWFVGLVDWLPFLVTAIIATAIIMWLHVKKGWFK